MKVYDVSAIVDGWLDQDTSVLNTCYDYGWPSKVADAVWSHVQKSSIDRVALPSPVGLVANAHLRDISSILIHWKYFHSECTKKVNDLEIIFRR